MEFLHLSTKLAYMFPNETKYLNDSQKIWNWIFTFDNGYGLMSDSYLVSTGAIPERCCNYTSSGSYTKCSNSKIPGTSYNQGLLISASAFLYVRTGNETYLMVGMKALEAILTNYTTKEGILIDEQRGFQSYESTCVNGGDPGGDYFSFNGVFMLHLAYFMETLANNKSLPPETFNKIKNLVEKTSDAAWTKSAVWPPFKKKDICDIGHDNPNVTYPKFHWWWGQEVVEQQILPPDPRQWFRKTTLRCVTLAPESQLWEGMLGSEDKCREKCEKNSTCSKYLYQIDPQSAVPGTDCWIWSYNRSDHVCHQYDYNFVTGVLRPDPEASCAGKCGSKVPIKMKQGMCYCDRNCTKHFDCCLDYADVCLPQNAITCTGLCNNYQNLLARVIPGGGYCWCDYGCRLDTCCTDYIQKCQQTPIPLCLDARSQGSAFNLFLVHLKLTEVISDYL